MADQPSDGDRIVRSMRTGLLAEPWVLAGLLAGQRCAVTESFVTTTPDCAGL